MTHGLLDQAQAATVETRKLVATALGLAANHPGSGTSPLFEELWAKYQNAQRCRHLADRPIQPSLMMLPHDAWLCRPCMGTLSHALHGTTLDPIEEFTCDRCRRYVRKLGPAIVRQDLWVIFLSLCRRCECEAVEQGAKLTRGAS